ncbi:hypothetical protein SAMN05216466_113214 [Paraburkholderia phenazinium]|uniref:Uncharacterized protein n=1 Tax=Paraburkholderia phenazinium TaxID=60549 RepID=A0A1G8FJY5_9BURK|nr:hypothetical protein SAMN05216466_113214 [Paraburkholderia phenazinium]
MTNENETGSANELTFGETLRAVAGGWLMILSWVALIVFAGIALTRLL